LLKYADSKSGHSLLKYADVRGHFLLKYADVRGHFLLKHADVRGYSWLKYEEAFFVKIYRGCHGICSVKHDGTL